MKEKKRRKPFILLDKKGRQIGRGICYDEGNVQVFMQSSQGEAWQMQLADVLHLEGVATFRWAY